jgi:branched-chain amino acid transport system ATP-binding protein
MTVLEVESVVKRFGGVIANDHVDLGVDEGEIVGLIGPNGAGKTTLFNCIAGYYRPDGGAIRLLGQDITGWPPHRTNKAGIARTFQIVKPMDGLTVEENVMVGAFCRTADRKVARREAQGILALLELTQVSDADPLELPLATQKRIELARALATKPRLLMLDECAAGLNPQETEAFCQLLRRIHREKALTMLVIEHVMEFVMPLSSSVVVLASGRVIAEGRPEEVAHNPRVIEAYLGERYARSG